MNEKEKRSQKNKREPALFFCIGRPLRWIYLYIGAIDRRLLQSKAAPQRPLLGRQGQSLDETNLRSRQFNGTRPHWPIDIHPAQTEKRHIRWISNVSVAYPTPVQ